MGGQRTGRIDRRTMRCKNEDGELPDCEVENLKVGFDKIIEKVSAGCVKLVLNSLTLLSSKDFWLSW